MRAPYLNDGDVVLYQGDCIEVMAEMEPESVDAVVCDPPYGLEFMGKEWDKFSPAPLVTRSGHSDADSGAGFGKWGSTTLPSFGGKRTSYECQECGRRDAFRKSGSCNGGKKHDWRAINPNGNASMVAFAAWTEQWASAAFRVLKPGGHLLAFGGTRTFHRLTCGIEDAGFEIRDCLSWLYGSGFPKSLDVSKAIDKAAGAERERQQPQSRKQASAAIHASGFGADGWAPQVNEPITDAAREWQGWGTALKPAWEPCVVARKPLAGTVAENVQRYGTGAVNVDGCRIAGPPSSGGAKSGAQGTREAVGAFGFDSVGIDRTMAQGRWPANVALDEQAAAMLDAQSGERQAGAAPKQNNVGFGGVYTDGSPRSGVQRAERVEMDSGGASRFYYTAKASRSDRTSGGIANNTHPTVKPTDLMRWLVRLVTPPGGIVLDPFAGSGSTLVAARAEGFRAIGIEREDEYARIIADRLAQLSLFAEGM